MSGRCNSFQIDEGIHVEGNGITLDIILKSFRGGRRNRSAILEIIENEASRLFHISYWEPSQEIIPGVSIQIASGKRVRVGSVALSYYCGDGFAHEWRTYPQFLDNND